MTPQNDTPQPVMLGGRRFVPVREGTLRHDLHYMQLVSQLGLQSLKMRPEEAPDEYAVRLLGEIVAAGTVLDLLGTLLVPEGTDPLSWSPQMARDTRSFLEGLTSPEDKAAVHAQVITLLLDFFERGMVSLWTSQRSSAADHPAVQGEAPSATAVGAQ